MAKSYVYRGFTISRTNFTNKTRAREFSWKYQALDSNFVRYADTKREAKEEIDLAYSSDQVNKLKFG